VKSATQRVTDGAIGGPSLGPAKHLVGNTAGALLIAILSGGLFWLVSVYGSALRDPRYLDGWVLAGGMSLQLGFHIAIKMAKLSPKSIIRWRKVHIFVGFLLVAAFMSHSDFSLPNSGFDWSLWAGFVLVTLSGIFGAYLAWSTKAKGRIEERVAYERIPARMSELAREVHDIVATPDPVAASIALPTPPYEAWIADLYTSHLHGFFAAHRNFSSHLIGSQRQLKRLTDEIDGLSRYVDAQGQEKLATISRLVVEKDRLDFARVHLALNRGWLFVHVPVTYALIVLSVLHVLVVYSFSSGAW